MEDPLIDSKQMFLKDAKNFIADGLTAEVLADKLYAAYHLGLIMGAAAERAHHDGLHDPWDE